MTAASEEFNRYGFVVDRNANKIQIKGAFEEAYGVTVDSVRTMNYAGKSKSRFTKAGFIEIALAIATRFIIPPLNSAGNNALALYKLTLFKQKFTLSFFSSSLMLVNMLRGKAIFSSTVR